MTRQEKYPNTKTFYFYNANPKNKMSGDCAARAICVALKQGWDTTIREMTELGIRYGYVFNDKKTIDKYLELKGWTKQKQPRKADGTKYTGNDFCEEIAEPGKMYIANIGGHHIVAISDKQIIDIWNSSYKSIGNYWEKI